MLLKEHVNFLQALHTFKMDQVYSNTRVPTQVNTSQHESTRAWHESTQINTSPTRVNTSLTRVNTSPTQVNTN